METKTDIQVGEERSESSKANVRVISSSSGAVSEPASFWTRNTFLIAASSLLVLWAWKLYSTWGAWGNLTIDSGRELYVPRLLSQGKMLYRDMRYLYGPAAPYFNSYLFRVFGVHLEVLYWAGSIAALLSAGLLLLSGIDLGFALVGWTAGAVLLMEAFQPSLFCFPLAYSFASVYGCAMGCAFLWFAIRAAKSPKWHWMFAAGMAAAAALLVKLEFGAACYATLALLMLLRALSQRTLKTVAIDAAAVLPGFLVCLLVIRWMVSIAGVEFITQENIESWPTSYFMKTYGQFWLEQNGFRLSLGDFRDALFRSAPLIGLVGFIENRFWRSDSLRTRWLRICLGVAVVIYVFALALQAPEKQHLESVFSALFFPTDMVLYVAIAAGICLASYAFRRDWKGSRSPLLIALSFATLLGFRMLMHMEPNDYAIYYNGPVILCFLVLAYMFLNRVSSFKVARWGGAAVCLGCLAAATLVAVRFEGVAASFVPYKTEYGTIRVVPALAKTYPAAVQFIEEKAAAGETVMSLPEDTSLYFLSNTAAPTRIYVFTPGAVPPGKQTTELIRQMEANHVKYLLWSNRTFVEYHAPIFGRDFNADLGDYLRANYTRIGPLTPPASFWDWNVILWERKAL